jgi:uncharacterized protein YifN (PemK superfamily)
MLDITIFSAVLSDSSHSVVIMPISFAPQRGAILLCDFDLGTCVPPEIIKKRQVLVISDTAFNHRHGLNAGLCTVVPFSASTQTPGRCDVFFPAGSYWSLGRDCWAQCKAIATVSHDRLDLLWRNGRRRPSEFLRAGDMERVEKAIRIALNL